MTTENVKKLFYKNKTMNYLNVCYYRFLRENKLIICAAGHIGQPIKLIDDNILLFLREIIHIRNYIILMILMKIIH